MDQDKDGQGVLGVPGEISFADLIIVAVRRRRVWLGITGIGILAAVGFFAYDRISPKPSSIYTSAIRAVALDAANGPTASILVASGACAELIGRTAEPPIAPADFRRAITTAYDKSRNILTITANATTAVDAKRFALAGYEGVRQLWPSYFGNGIALGIAQRLDAVVTETPKSQATSSMPTELWGSVSAAANARSMRILAEAYVAVAGNNLGVYSPIGLDGTIVVKASKSAEEIALAAVAARLGLSHPSPAVEAVISNLAIDNLSTYSGLYHSLAITNLESFRLLDQTESVVAQEAFSKKKVAIIVFASLALGLLVAFAMDSWDKIKANPTFAARLRAAKKPRANGQDEGLRP